MAYTTRVQALLVAAALLPAPVAAADLVYMNGRQLVGYCEATDAASAERGLCEGYLTGLADAATTLRHWQRAAPGFCVPREASPFRLRQVFLEWTLDAGPELDTAAAGVALNAFRHAFPCR